MGDQGAYQDRLWRELRHAHGGPMPQAARAFLAAQHARALAEQSPLERVVQDMLDTIANLQANNLWPPDAERPLKLTPATRRDRRWALWRELDSRRAKLLGLGHDEPPWTPLRVARLREAGTITLTFDRRLPNAAVRDALRRELPRLRARGWTHATRPLSALELALVRYVCLESSLTTSWRKRTNGWRHSRFCEAHPKWGKPYRGKRAARRFKKDFHRAEATLAGSEGALALYCDPQVRERLRLRHTIAEAESALRADAATLQQEITARVDPAKAEALRARFAAGAEIEALVARAQAGDAAAPDEAIALCLRWRPAAIDELYARLGRVRDDAPDDPEQSGEVE